VELFQVFHVNCVHESMSQPDDIGVCLCKLSENFFVLPPLNCVDLKSINIPFIGSIFFFFICVKGLQNIQH
jgi:hypothetical protein